MCELCTGRAIVRNAGEGESIWFDGGLLTITAAAEDTGGAFRFGQPDASQRLALSSPDLGDAAEGGAVVEAVTGQDGVGLVGRDGGPAAASKRRHVDAIGMRTGP